jgi:hypothetical protein
MRNQQPISKFGRLLVLALCCVLLLFMSVEVAHLHATTAQDGAHCQLCMAAHVALHGGFMLAATIVLSLTALVEAGQVARGFCSVRSVSRIRPPPLGQSSLYPV